jgi:hypothetical protein
MAFDCGANGAGSGDRSDMSKQWNPQFGFMTGSLLLTEFAAEREEILRHKWIESEKAQQDIGFEKALMGWLLRHRSGWLAERRRLMGS